MGQWFGQSIFAALLGVALMAGAAACSPEPTYEPLATLENAPPPPFSAKAYRLGPGDEVEIKFIFAPELNDHVTVRPDGKISFMFAQDIQAAGLTTDELSADLRAALARNVKQLDMVIIVRNFASQKAYVGGEVGRPGLLPLTGSENLMQVLAEAGWVTPAGGGKVLLVRRDFLGAQKVYPINLDELRDGKNMEQNVMVQPGDMIFVPPSGIIVSDRIVDQYLRQMLPFSTSIGAYYNINSSIIQ